MTKIVAIDFPKPSMANCSEKRREIYHSITVKKGSLDDIVKTLSLCKISDTSIEDAIIRINALREYV